MEHHKKITRSTCVLFLVFFDAKLSIYQIVVMISLSWRTHKILEKLSTDFDSTNNETDELIEEIGLIAMARHFLMPWIDRVVLILDVSLAIRLCVRNE